MHPYHTSPFHLPGASHEAQGTTRDHSRSHAHWLGIVHAKRWEELGNTDDAEPQVDYVQTVATKEGEQERRRNIQYHNYNNMNDQIYRIVETMGAEKEVQWTNLLSDLHSCLSNNQIPIIFDCELAPPSTNPVLEPNFGSTRTRSSWKWVRSA